MLKKRAFSGATKAETTSIKVVQKIRKDNNGTYDCVLGVSGGVDSSYLAYLAAQAGLKVLCVHFDNGWNSELAVANIQQIVERCGFELHTFVIDWNEFKDIQLAYFQANVVDIEAVTDIAIFSALDSITRSYGIKHIIDGRNVSTENTLPKSWYCKDANNLLDIHRRVRKVKLEKTPVDGANRTSNQNPAKSNTVLAPSQFCKLIQKHMQKSALPKS